MAEAMANAPADIAARAARTTVVGAAGLMRKARSPRSRRTRLRHRCLATNDNAAPPESAGTTSPQGA